MRRRLPGKPAARARYGTGGLNVLKPEINDETHTRGAVSATQIPGKADSAGSQFFISVSDQLALDGKYTIFARVVEGMLAAQTISETAVDDKGLAVDRVVVNKVTIRDKPAATPEPTRRLCTCVTFCASHRPASTTA